MAPRQNDWQLLFGQIRERAGHILKAEQWTDCSFLVGTEAERMEIRTHKLILGMASPVFEAMFYGPIAEGDAAVVIPDMQPAAFRALIEYIYTDNITLETHTMACELYYGAQKYMLPHLQTVCTAYLSSNLNPEVVCSIYEFAMMVGEESLVKDCEKLIQQKTTEVLKGSSFLEAQLETVEKIYSMQPLNIESELVLIKAAEQYNRGLSRARTAKMFEKAMNNMAGKPQFKFSMPDKKDLAKVICSSVSEIFQTLEGVEKPSDDKITNENEPSTHKADNTLEIVKPEKEKAGSKLETSVESILKVVKKEDDRQILRVLQKIYFLTLTTQQIAEERCLGSLLTSKELLAIVMNSASMNSFVPMPAGFSKSRTHRRNGLDCQITNSSLNLTPGKTYKLTGNK